MGGSHTFVTDRTLRNDIDSANIEWLNSRFTFEEKKYVGLLVTFW